MHKNVIKHLRNRKNIKYFIILIMFFGLSYFGYKGYQNYQINQIIEDSNTNQTY